MKPAAVALMLLVSALDTLDADTIMRRAVVADAHDLAAVAQFECTERRQTEDGSKTYFVTMMNGSPHARLLAQDDQPLSNEDNEREEQKKETAARLSREREPAADRDRRLSEYTSQRERNRVLLDQATHAFECARERNDRVDGFDVYVATVEPGTHFTLEQSQVEPDIWVPKHLFMRAHGRILLLFNKRAQLDATYFVYHRASTPR